MARPVIHNIEARAAQLGISKRMGARLDALARTNVYVSEVVLEMLGGDKGADALRALLLSPELLEGAPMLDKSGLRRLCAHIGDEAFFKANPLTLLTGKDARCIALAEEEPHLDLEHAAVSPAALVRAATISDASSLLPRS